MKQETLCWGCQNYAKCSWARGIPVEGWEATPTCYIDKDGDSIREVHSFCVHSCPQFEADAKQRKSVKEIGTIVHLHERTIFRYLKKKSGRLKLRELLKEQGYKLHICKEIYEDNGKEIRTYYLEKIGGINESN